MKRSRKRCKLQEKARASIYRRFSSCFSGPFWSLSHWISWKLSKDFLKPPILYQQKNTYKAPVAKKIPPKHREVLRMFEHTLQRPLQKIQKNIKTFQELRVATRHQRNLDVRVFRRPVRPPFDERQSFFDAFTRRKARSPF